MSKNNKWTSEFIEDQTGKIVIVTGANSGIGFETARALAKKNATVIMACRDAIKGKAAVSKIRCELPNAKVELMELDLSSQQSIRDFVSVFNKKYNSLHLLINNAGVMIPPYTKTVDGFELQFGTNHLGHFALTGLLLDVILNTENSRVVTVSSGAHRVGKIHFEDLNWENDYKAWEAYGQSKLANLLFTYELQRKLENMDSKTIAVAAHPGWTGTNLQQHSGFIRFLNPFFSQKQEQGALPTLYAATAMDVKGSDYYGPDGFQELKGYPKKVQSNDRSHDETVAAKLWTVSEELTEIRYETLNN